MHSIQTISYNSFSYPEADNILPSYSYIITWRIFQKQLNGGLGRHF
jgi:hypothetical protein